MAVVAVLTAATGDNKINRMTMETVAIPNSRTPSHKDNRPPQVALTTPMQLVSFNPGQSRTLLTQLDGGYANYAQLWYQALAAQGQGDTTKPPGTS